MSIISILGRWKLRAAGLKGFRGSGTGRRGIWGITVHEFRSWFCESFYTRISRKKEEGIDYERRNLRFREVITCVRMKWKSWFSIWIHVGCASSNFSGSQKSTTYALPTSSYRNSEDEFSSGKEGQWKHCSSNWVAIPCFSRSAKRESTTTKFCVWSCARGKFQRRLSTSTSYPNETASKTTAPKSSTPLCCLSWSDGAACANEICTLVTLWFQLVFFAPTFVDDSTVGRWNKVWNVPFPAVRSLLGSNRTVP